LEYIYYQPQCPHAAVNVISNGDYELVTGSGYTIIGSRRDNLRHGILQHYFTHGAVENVLEPILEME
jgi:hypothetical protein